MKKYKLSVLFTAAVLLCSCGEASSETAEAKPYDPNRREVTILAYPSLSDGTDKNAVSFTRLEDDLKTLKASGSEAVLVNDLIRFVNYDGELPEKPVVLTVDDAKLNCLTKLLPLAEKYDVCFSIALKGDKAEHASDDAEPDSERSYLDWKSIYALRESGRFEFTNSTCSLYTDTGRHGCTRLRSEDEREYRRLLYGDVFRLQRLCDECCQFKPNAFVYPLGYTDKAAEEVISECGFEATMTIGKGTNIIKKNKPETLIDLKRQNRA